MERNCQTSNENEDGRSRDETALKFGWGRTGVDLNLDRTSFQVFNFSPIELLAQDDVVSSCTTSFESCGVLAVSCFGAREDGRKNANDVHRTFATLREIEDRLKSIRNIEKITNTMKIVASTKLTRAQRAMRESRQYGQTSNTVFEQAETKPLEGDDKKTLIVVASSDKGLCGGIHSGLTKRVRKMLIEKPNADLVVLGEKCKAQLSRSNAKNIQLSFAGVGKDIPTFADAQAIADQISLLPADYGSIQIVYNKFINATSYEATPIEAFSEEAIVNSRKLFRADALIEI
jgi:hypothetical protein